LKNHWDLSFRCGALLSKLSKEWEKKLAYFEHVGTRVYLRRMTPFNIRLQRAINKLEAQCKAVDGAIDRLTERDKQLFSKVTKAYSANNTKKANVYASELAEVRKTVDFMIKNELILEKMTLKLSTLHQLGNAAVTLVPATETLQNIRKGIRGILPDVDTQLGSVTDMLSQVIIESGQSSGITPASEVASEDATGILKEAALIVEEEKKDQLPDVPAQKSMAGKRVGKETEI
jgi:division protein CdvB (Snf7/Vps24/ESCRT-III family)